MTSTLKLPYLLSLQVYVLSVCMGLCRDCYCVLSYCLLGLVIAILRPRSGVTFIFSGLFVLYKLHKNGLHFLQCVFQKTEKRSFSGHHGKFCFSFYPEIIKQDIVATSSKC